MLRIALVLCAALTLALLLERRLDGARSERAGGAQSIPLLIDSARRSGITVAAIEIARPGREDALLYLRAKGLWRAAQAFGAVADQREIEALIAALTHARGVWRTSDPAKAAEYGFGRNDAIVVSFHGPKVLDAEDRDLLFSFDLGRSFESGLAGACFVRESGTDRIVEIDRDPRALLTADPTLGLPPMIDTRLMAGATPSDFKGFREFFIDFETGETLHLSSGPGHGPDEPVAWTLDDERKPRHCPPWRIAGYSTMWFRAECSGLGDPRRAADIGLDPPYARVTLVLVEDEPVEFALSRVNAKNDMYVWNKRTNVVYVVPGEMQSLLAPDAGMFLDEARENPWERWLSK